MRNVTSLSSNVTSVSRANWYQIGNKTLPKLESVMQKNDIYVNNPKSFIFGT